MGGGGSAPRRVTFEADENDNITVVKGVRLSENVIERMKEPSSPGGRSQQKAGSSGHSSIGGKSDLALSVAVYDALIQFCRVEVADLSGALVENCKASSPLLSCSPFLSSQLFTSI